MTIRRILKELCRWDITGAFVNKEKIDSALTSIASEIEGMKKPHEKWCRSFIGKNFQCNCMRPEYNQAITEVVRKIKE